MSAVKAAATHLATSRWLFQSYHQRETSVNSQVQLQMSESSQSVQVRVNRLVRCSCLSYDVDSVVTSVSRQNQRPQPRCIQSASNTAAVGVKIHHDKSLANSQERVPGSGRQCSAVLCQEEPRASVSWLSGISASRVTAAQPSPADVHTQT